MTPRDLTMVMAVYGQPQMLAKQLATIEGYPDAVLDRLHLIVVDDCGSPPVTIHAIDEIGHYCKSAKLFRVEEDIPWNQMGARNLGMHHAEGWCVMLDPDMVIPPSVMSRMLEAVDKLRRKSVAKFALRHVADRRIDMTSPNTYIIHRDDFFMVGGYDEDYAGHKGWSDVQMLDVLTGCFKIELRPDLFADFYNESQIEDAMVTSLDRSVKANRRKRVKKRDKARDMGGWARFARKQRDAVRLRFKWRQVC